MYVLVILQFKMFKPGDTIYSDRWFLDFSLVMQFQDCFSNW